MEGTYWGWGKVGFIVSLYLIIIDRKVKRRCKGTYIEAGEFGAH